MKTPTQATSGHSSQRTVWKTADNVIVAYPTTVVPQSPGLLTAVRRDAKSDAIMAAIEPRNNTRRPFQVGVKSAGFVSHRQHDEGEPGDTPRCLHGPQGPVGGPVPGLSPPAHADEQGDHQRARSDPSRPGPGWLPED